jgi:hypothetical protein
MTLLIRLPENSGGRTRLFPSISFHHGSPCSYIIWRWTISPLWPLFREIVSPHQHDDNHISTKASGYLRKRADVSAWFQMECCGRQFHFSPHNHLPWVGYEVHIYCTVNNKKTVCDCSLLYSQLTSGSTDRQTLHLTYVVRVYLLWGAHFKTQTNFTS